MLPGISKAPTEDLLRKLRERDRDPLRWARKILANPKAYPAYSLKLAGEALAGMPRQPGEDEEEGEAQ